MNKFTLLVLTFLVAGFWTVHADENGSAFRITPPPVPCLKFFPGVKQFSLTGIHFKMGELEDQAGLGGAPVAYGFNANFAFSSPKPFLGAQNGAILTFSYLNISMPMNISGLYEEEISTNAYNLGYYGVLDLVSGEKRDLAGEIVALKPTVALFFGTMLNYFSLNMGPLYQVLGNEEDVIARNLTTNFSAGIAADIPIGYFIALVPFFRYTASMSSMFMKVPEPFNPDNMYTEQFTSSYSYTDYGTDIDIRPFRNAPDWIISLGMAMAQVQGLKNGNRLITLSIKHEMGRYYSSTKIGPGLH